MPPKIINERRPIRSESAPKSGMVITATMLATSVTQSMSLVVKPMP